MEASPELTALVSLQTCSQHSLVLRILSFLFVWYLHDLHSCQLPVISLIILREVNNIMYSSGGRGEGGGGRGEGGGEGEEEGKERRRGGEGRGKGEGGEGEWMGKGEGPEETGIFSV